MTILLREFKGLIDLAELSRKLFDLLPVSELDNRIRICGALSHPYNETDHQTIKSGVYLIIDLACKHLQLLWLPRNLLKRFSKIGIGIGLALFRFACHSIHREKCIEFTL